MLEKDRRLHVHVQLNARLRPSMKGTSERRRVSWLGLEVSSAVYRACCTAVCGKLLRCQFARL